MWNNDTNWANAIGKIGEYRLTPSRVATNLLFVKKKKKKNPMCAKCNKTRYACSLSIPSKVANVQHIFDLKNKQTAKVWGKQSWEYDTYQ